MAIELSAPTDGNMPYFPPESAIRRVHEEGILILGGGRSLLMQVAHPSVARGVAEHSTYKRERLDRLLRTLRATFAIIYGSREQATSSAEGMNRIHQRVTGEGYRAMDPELLVWVLATLIDTTIVMHERFVGPISPEDAAAYYEDAIHVGSMLSIPDGRMPSSLEALHAYVAEMADSLQVSGIARDIAAELFAPLPATGPAMALMRQLTAGLLSPHLRSGFGLSWGPGREAQLRTLQAMSRAVLPKLPSGLRRPPAFVLPPRTSGKDLR